MWLMLKSKKKVSTSSITIIKLRKEIWCEFLFFISDENTVCMNHCLQLHTATASTKTLLQILHRCIISIFFPCKDIWQMKTLNLCRRCEKPCFSYNFAAYSLWEPPTWGLCRGEKKKTQRKRSEQWKQIRCTFSAAVGFFFTLLSCKLSFTKHHCNCHVFTSLHAFRVSIQLPKHFTSESLITSLQAVSRHGAAHTGDFISTSQRSSS